MTPMWRDRKTYNSILILIALCGQTQGYERDWLQPNLIKDHPAQAQMIHEKIKFLNYFVTTFGKVY